MLRHMHRLALVALQMTNQVPGDGKVCKRCLLGLPFLHTILAEMAHPNFIQLTDAFSWLRLGNSDNRNLLRASPRPHGRSLDSVPNLRKMISQNCRQITHRANSSTCAKQSRFPVICTDAGKRLDQYGRDKVTSPGGVPPCDTVLLTLDWQGLYDASRKINRT